ncbi:MAG: hypothetical protein KAW88_04545 [Candidatus Cloacimonetes bacterium]|nr:hypothetical protein [Candidatus Cloacimonadota bacterium]
MKKIITLFIILVNISLIGLFNPFNENPAEIADRKNTEIYYPIINSDFNFSNSLVNIYDLNIFTEGHKITKDEKKTLTKDDLKMYISYNVNIFRFGKQNWDVAFTTHAFGKSKVLSKEFAELIFYGNEEEEYTANSGEGTKGFVFSKIAFNYAFPNEYHMTFLPESNKKGNFLDSIREIPIYLGLKFNIYYPYTYFGVPKSRQKFGSTDILGYYTYDYELNYSDEKTSNRLSAGLGFGIKAKYSKGTIHFSLDDIFGSLNFDDLYGKTEERIYEDTLAFLHPDHEATSIHNTQEFRIKDKLISISPTFMMGFDYHLNEILSFMAKYKNSKYEYPDGFSVGVDYHLANKIPIQFNIGTDRNFYYEFKTGILSKRFEYMLSVTFFDGFLIFSKGFGIKTGIKYKY